MNNQAPLNQTKNQKRPFSDISTDQISSNSDETKKKIKKSVCSEEIKDDFLSTGNLKRRKESDSTCDRSNRYDFEEKKW